MTTSEASKVRGFSWKEYFHRAGLKKCKLRFLLMAFLIPIMYHFVSYGIFWLIFPESLQINELSPSLILPYFIIVFLCAFGEELGWRGYTVPALFERLGLKKTLIVSGLIWAAWHLPMIFFGSYNEGTSLPYKFVAFMLDIMPAAMIMAIFTLKSGSIWPATVFHASHNYFDQIILRPMTVADNKMYFISETGIISIICIWAFAIGIYIHEKKSNTLETHTLD